MHFLFWASMAWAAWNPFTDLGEVGNRAVELRFEEYLSSGKGCFPARPELPRVMLSGFGLFSGIDFNISGAVIASLMSESGFDPSDQGKLEDSDRGARVINRVLKIGEREVSACLLILDVRWDFAAAILVREMESFKPDAIVMTGVGGATAVIEAGALNEATELSGFNPDGSVDRDNRPIAPKILEDQPEGEIPMTWDQLELASQVQSKIEAEGYRLSLPRGARYSNDYICNNVSYVVLQGARSRRLNLAGGRLVLTPQIESPPPIGFFHYPMSVPFAEESIRAWAGILIDLADRSLIQ